MMNEIADFFDEYNVEHLAAYKHLQETGSWPDGFIPDDCELPPSWPYQLTSMMSKAYIELAISGQIFGMAPHEQ